MNAFLACMAFVVVLFAIFVAASPTPPPTCDTPHAAIAMAVAKKSC